MKQQSITYKDAISIAKNSSMVILNTLIEEFKAGVLNNSGILNPNLKDTDFFNGQLDSKFREVAAKHPDAKGIKGKIPTICLFHATVSKDSTNFLVFDNTTKIGCFSGHCSTLNGSLMELIDVYVLAKTGLRKKTKKELTGLSEEAAKKANAEYNKAFFEAVKLIVEKQGMEIEKKNFDRKPKVLTKEEIKNQRLKELSSKIRDFYHEQFLNSEEAMSYFLEKRGFKNATDPKALIEKHKIGFAPQQFPSTVLIEHLEADYSTEELLEVGAAMFIKDEKELVDKFSYSLMISYWDANLDATLHRYGRSMDPKVNKSYRHMRTSGEMEMPLNFYQAVRSSNGKVCAAEGEITSLSMETMGIHNVFATFGTNGFKDKYMQMLKDAGIKEVNLVYDSDEPGITAAISVGRRLIAQGFIVTVTILETGKDANDYLRLGEKEAFLEAVNSAIPFHQFMMRHEWEDIKDINKMISRFEEIVLEDELNDVQKFAMAEFLSLESLIPLDVIWKTVHKASNNKNEALLKKEQYVYITKDIESFYLMNFATSMCVYLEDFDVFDEPEELRAGLFIIESKGYSEEEINFFNEFCIENNLKRAYAEDFKTYIESSVKFSELKKDVLKV